MPLTVDRFARQLDWNLLRTFLVIAEERNLTRAGERLFLCQPTISGALRRLEERLGCRLVLREPGRFELTDEGERLYEHCVNIYASISAIGEIKARAEHQLTGRVRLRTISGISSPVLDEVIARFSASNPRVQFELSVGHSRDIVTAISKGMIPLGISLLKLDSAELDYHLLYDEHFAAYCGAGHPLFGRRSITAETLRPVPWVNYACEHDPGVLHPLAAFKRSWTMGDHVIAIAETVEELRSLLRGGLGIGFLPRHAAEGDVRDGRLWELKLDVVPPAVRIYVVSNTAMPLAPVEESFRAALLKHPKVAERVAA